MTTEESSETGLVPGTTSKILWHFTGGPPEIDGKRIKDRKKPDDKAFSILRDILGSGFLKASKETVRFKTDEDPEPKPVLSFYCCCVAEIPIQHLRYHADWYGKSALGFRRENLKGTYRFRPVQYAFDHDDWAIPNADSLRGFIEYAFGAQKEIIYAISKTLELSESSMPKEERQRLIEFMKLIKPPFELLLRLLLAPKAQLRFTKSFHEQDFGTIYCEREWRKIYKGDTSEPTSIACVVNEDGVHMVEVDKVDKVFMEEDEGLKFKPEDVSFIVCPGNYVNELALRIQDEDDFKKYFGIPVVAFEDLLEH